MGNKILMFLGIEFVIDVEPMFGEHRVVQRGKKQIIQKLVEGYWCYDDYWEDIREVDLWK